jgi:hypothetical protein
MDEGDLTIECGCGDIHQAHQRILASGKVNIWWRCDRNCVLMDRTISPRCAILLYMLANRSTVRQSDIDREIQNDEEESELGRSDSADQEPTS